jgi:hypothetical protein
MPVTRQKPVKVSKPVAEKKQRCITCGQFGDFYASKNKMHKKYGRLPWCKECLISFYDEAYKRFQQNERSIIEICKITNTPFIKDCYLTAEKQLQTQGRDIVFGYFATLAMFKSTSAMFFIDSDIFDYSGDGILCLREKNKDKEQVQKAEEIVEEKEEILTPKIDVKDEEFFGLGYTPEEYRAMRKKYEFLKSSYNEVTNMHTEALIKYIRYSVKEELASAKGSPAEAKAWGTLAGTAAEKAKLNPSQLTKADLMGGANSFAEINQAIEQACDIIPILPIFKYRANDAIDMLLWDYVDYNRHLQGLPTCSYEDIYKFYDKRKAEYIKTTGDPYGIYKDDPTEKNREAIIQFLSDIEQEPEIEKFISGDEDE